MIMLNSSVARNGRRPLYERGQVVRHQRYGYRGVIVDFDHECLADEQWYKANKTQPNRSQPWYHVLVHDTDGATYAAQDSLQAELGSSPIQHPLIERFFSGFVDGRHIRNDQPWQP